MDRQFGVLGLVILVLDILAILELFKSPKTATEKLLWTLLILLAPFLGLIIYWLFGRKGAALPKA